MLVRLRNDNFDGCGALLAKTQAQTIPDTPTDTQTHRHRHADHRYHPNVATPTQNAKLVSTSF